MPEHVGGTLRKGTSLEFRFTPTEIIKQFVKLQSLQWLQPLLLCLF